MLLVFFVGLGCGITVGIIYASWAMGRIYNRQLEEIKQERIDYIQALEGQLRVEQQRKQFLDAGLRLQVRISEMED